MYIHYMEHDYNTAEKQRTVYIRDKKWKKAKRKEH